MCLAHEKCHKNETQRVGRVFVTTQDLVVIWGMMDPMLVFLFLDSQICRPQDSVSNVAVWLVWSQGAIKTQKLSLRKSLVRLRRVLRVAKRRVKRVVKNPRMKLLRCMLTVKLRETKLYCLGRIAY